MTATLTTSRVFITVLFLGLFAMAARNVNDPDLWWHLRTGQLIVEHRSVPHVDPFSFTRAGLPWVAHEWLSDILLYEVELALGWGGLIIVFATVISATFFLLYLRCGAQPYIAGATTLCAALATIPVWGVRPQMLSLFLTSLWLLMLERSEAAPKVLWWSVPLTLLWVNLHAGFALGLALSAVFLIGSYIEHAFGQSPKRTSNLRISAIVLALDLLIVPINPNGLRLLWYPIETLRSAAMQNYIAEWASPDFHHPEYGFFLLMVLGTFALLSWSRMPARPRDLLLLLVSLYAGLCSIRLMPLFVFIAAPLISKQIGTMQLRNRAGRNSQLRPARIAILSLLNGVIVLVMITFAVVQTGRTIRQQPQAEMERFPLRAVAFLQAHPPKGPIFNHYDWGGYLIWKLYPSTRVFIDGRADLYGEPLLRQFADAYQFRDAWRQTLLRWSIGTVIVPADSALATGLRGAPGWTVSYEDSLTIILTAGTASGKTGTPQASGRFQFGY